MHTFARLLLFCFGLLVCAQASAAAVTIVPQLIDSSEPVTRALQENQGHASTNLKGKGASLRLVYSSESPLQVYMVATDDQGSFVPTDFMSFSLPAAPQQAEAIIDLTVSPGWSPGEQQYVLHLLSPREDAQASFYEAEFLPASGAAMLAVPFKHFLRAEPYTPGTFHALFGYRVLGTSVTIILGLITVLFAVALLGVLGFRSAKTVFILLIAAQLVYSLRFGLDLVRFSNQHLREYASTGSFDEAGFTYTTAADIRQLALASSSPVSVYFCRDGTNFKEKLLRYFVYPIPVVSDATGATKATMVLVSGKFKQGYSFADNRLQCGDIEQPAKTISTYPDGTELYLLNPPSA